MRQCDDRRKPCLGDRKAMTFSLTLKEELL